MLIGQCYVVLHGSSRGVYLNDLFLRESGDVEYRVFSSLDMANLYYKTNGLIMNDIVEEDVYVVLIGRYTGMYFRWSDAYKQIKNYKDAYFKKCGSLDEAELFYRKYRRFSKKDLYQQIEEEKILLEKEEGYYNNYYSNGRYYYAVAIGEKPGIYTNRFLAEKQTIEYKNGLIKKFTSYEDAKTFIDMNSINENDIKNERYYVVLNGRKVGIFSELEEARQQVLGYKDGFMKVMKNINNAIKYFYRNISKYMDVQSEKVIDAIYRIDNYMENMRDFNSKKIDECRKYLYTNNEFNELKTIEPIAINDKFNLLPGEAIAFIDGSYNQLTKKASYGVSFYDNENKFIFNGVSSDEKLNLCNVHGELKAAIFALELAKLHKCNKLYLHFDYIGIRDLAIGNVSANHIGTQIYKDYINNLSDIDVIYKKVKAHSGNKCHDEADVLAKKALIN